jgi:flagellar M-ring protein FliF
LQNLRALWASLDLRRRVIVVGATVAVFVAVLGLSRMAAEPGLSLLYAGLDGAAAGEVIAALEQEGVAYQIRGDAIHVPSDLRDGLRMTLAAQGLPATGGAGYELLDSLSGFGTTAQMFDAAYGRAREGELARTILANPKIRAARVHIAAASEQPFRQDARPTASVTVTTAGGGLDQGQAQALRHLVAAAVPDLRPEDVAVIDSVAGLVPLPEDSAGTGPAAPARAAVIRDNVERLLAARVGAGRAVVEVAVELVSQRESITERILDPQGRVAISSETEERSDSSSQAEGDVSVASNLPEGDAAAGGSDRSASEENRERVNYEVSETQREVLRLPGDIARLSVAVLVDGVPVTAADGTVTVEPRPDEELEILRELVASAVGLDEERGDVLTLRSLAFEPLPDRGTVAEAGMLGGLGPIDTMAVVQIAVLALVSLVLGLFVIRPILTGARRAPELALDAPLALPPAGPARPDVLDGEIQDLSDLPLPPQISSFGEGADEALDPVARLRRLIAERQSESVEILRGWMEAEEEKA